MRRLIAVFTLLPTIAFAQQPGQPTPHDTAMGAEIMACVGEKVQVREQLATAQAQLAAAQQELAKLKAAEPAKPSEAEPPKK